MKVFAAHPLIGVLLWAAVLAGCQSADDVPLASDISLPAATTAQPAAGTTPTANGPAGDAASAQVASNTEEFTPPFPDRVDFFVPPRRARAVQRGDEVVELRGFITPPDDQGTRVLLAINGTESPVAVGQEKMGVKVISIEQPKVVLQRGRTRWTETLE